MTQHIMEQQGQDMKIQDTAKEINDALEAAFDILIERRDTAYAAAIVPLNAESESLAQEHGDISEAAQSLELLLPAKARIAQYEADKLTVSEKSEEAKAKLEEMETARNAPALMRARQQQIADRIDEIVKEKQDAARGIFHEWLEAEVCLVVRAASGIFQATTRDRSELRFLPSRDRHRVRYLQTRQPWSVPLGQPAESDGNRAVRRVGHRTPVVWWRAVRLCPLARVDVPCSEAAPLLSLVRVEGTGNDT